MKERFGVGEGGRNDTGGRCPLFVWEVYVFAVLLHVLLALFSPAQITVYQDEITYRVMSRDLMTEGRIHRELPYRMSVPPLYPLVLAPTNLFQDPEIMYRITLIFNAALFFSALFPIYRIARRYMEPRHAVWALVLLALAPQTIYASWGMSENLYFPLFAWFLRYLLEAGDAQMPQRRVVALGLTLAGCMLTRLSGLQAAALLPLLLALRYRAVSQSFNRRSESNHSLEAPTSNLRNNQETLPDKSALLERHLFPLGIAALIVSIVWWLFGYVGPGSKGIFYQPNPSGPLVLGTYLWDLGYWSCMNLTGYILSTGMVLFALACYGMMQPSREVRDIRRLFIATLVVLLAGVAAVSANLERLSPGYWHPITRYMFYLNILLFPLALLGWKRLREKAPLTTLAWIGLLVAMACFAFVHGEAHESLKMVRAWFADAPDLEFYRHIAKGIEYPWGPRAANVTLIGGGLAILALCRFYPRTGLVWLAILLINLKIQTYDYQDQLLRRHEAIYGPVRDFAWMVQRDEIEDVPVIVINYDDMVRPLGNLFYWTNHKDIYLDDGFAWVNSGYFLTNEEKTDPLVYKKGEWRVYRFAK